MPRAKKSAASLATESNIDPQAVSDLHKTSGQQIAEREAHLAIVDASYALDGPYDFQGCLARLVYLKEDTGRRLLEMGRILVLVREHETRERYADVLEQSGISPRFAQRTMQAAIKFGYSDTSKMLATRLGTTKLLELIDEDDGELSALKDGGTVAGLTLDEIDTMTTRQLRAALRDANNDLEAKDEVIAAKSKKLDDMALKMRRAKKTPLREQAEELMRGVHKSLAEYIASCETLRLSIDAINELYGEAGEDIEADIAAQLEHAGATARNNAETVAESANA